MTAVERIKKEANGAKLSQKGKAVSSAVIKALKVKRKRGRKRHE